jgi:hypothetical protein
VEHVSKVDKLITSAANNDVEVPLCVLGGGAGDSVGIFPRNALVLLMVSILRPVFGEDV